MPWATAGTVLLTDTGTGSKQWDSTRSDNWGRQTMISDRLTVWPSTESIGYYVRYESCSYLQQAIWRVYAYDPWTLASTNFVRYRMYSTGQHNPDWLDTRSGALALSRNAFIHGFDWNRRHQRRSRKFSPGRGLPSG